MGIYLLRIWNEIDRRMPNPKEFLKDIDTHNIIIQTKRVYEFLVGINENQDPLPFVENTYQTIGLYFARGGIM